MCVAFRHYSFKLLLQLEKKYYGNATLLKVLKYLINSYQQ